MIHQIEDWARVEEEARAKCVGRVSEAEWGREGGGWGGLGGWVVTS